MDCTIESHKKYKSNPDVVRATSLFTGYQRDLDGLILLELWQCPHCPSTLGLVADSDEARARMAEPDPTEAST